MNEIMIVILCLFFVLVAGRKIYPNIVLSPQFIFCVGWIFSLSYLLLFKVRWNIELDLSTCFFLITGPTAFVIIALLFLKKNKNLILKENALDLDTQSIVYIEKSKLILCVVFQIIVLTVIIVYILRFVGIDSISDGLLANRNIGVEGDAIDFPAYIGIGRGICLASGYICLYAFANNIVYGYKSNLFWLVINIIINACINLVFVARGDLVKLLCAGGIMFYFAIGKKNNWSKRASKKYIKRIGILSAGGLLLFQQLGGILGRKEVYSFKLLDYLAIYVCGPIVNFDINLKTNYLTSVQNVNKNITFRTLLNYFGTKYNIESLVSRGTINIHRYSNGYYIGNVSTTYSAFIHDGGIGFFLFCVILMALLSNIFLFLSIDDLQNKRGHISINCIIYSQMCFGLLFSFFANEYFGNIFSIEFIRQIIYLFILRFYIEKIKIRIR